MAANSNSKIEKKERKKGVTISKAILANRRLLE
jgi:hypothetical protein